MDSHGHLIDTLVNLLMRKDCNCCGDNESIIQKRLIVKSVQYKFIAFKRGHKEETAFNILKLETLTDPVKPLRSSKFNSPFNKTKAIRKILEVNVATTIKINFYTWRRIDCPIEANKAAVSVLFAGHFRHLDDFFGIQ